MIQLHEFCAERAGKWVFEPLSLQVERGARVGLAGESGCGKTTILKAITGLLDTNASVRGLISATGCIGYIPQESPVSLSPFRTLLDQVADVGQGTEQARRLLGDLGIIEERLLRSYPHQVSGGQRQRVLIAQALITNPDMLVCDEPVANLDTSTAAQVLEQIDQYLRASGAGLLIASHREEVFRALGCRVHRMTPACDPEPRPASSLKRDLVVATARHVSKTYFSRDFFLRQCPETKALTDVDFSVSAGETVAVIGPSGSGKSTLLRCLTQRETFDDGTIRILGQPLELVSKKHRVMQLIPQECSESLNPRMTVQQALREANPAADLHGLGLPESWAQRKTRELSTGQRARVAIARALAALESGLLILDESLSSLDMATANSVVRLIRNSQREKGLACVLIAHDDFAVVAMADRVLHMEAGRIVA